MTLKVSNTLNYLVGFNVFPSATATSIIATGDSELLSWMISDTAISFSVTALMSLAAVAILV